MRTRYITLIGLFLHLTLLSQVRQIHSDFDWQAGLTEDSPFNLSTVTAFPCVDEEHIDTMCGDFYDSPMLDEHFVFCKQYEPIWATDAPDNCRYNGDDYWFRKEFTLTAEEYTNLLRADATIQADNIFTFYLNGQLIGTEDMWFREFEYEVMNQLQEGSNEILVEVVDLQGGSCFNYAFLAFCLELAFDQASSTAHADSPQTSSEFTAFPNPASHQLGIHGIECESCELSLMNSSGITVLTKTGIQPNVQVDIPPLASGLYFFEIRDANQSFVGKIVITQ